MIGPSRSHQIFDSYIGMFLLSEDEPSLTDIHIQATWDERLTMNQRLALDSVFLIRMKILGDGA